MAGGLGTRMRSALPKHLHPILGRRMVDWVLEAARPLDPSPLVVVASPDTATSFDGLDVAVQERPLGTGDAVRSAREALSGADEVLVLSGDTPLLTTELLDGLLGTHRESGAAATVLSFVPDDIRSVRADRARRGGRSRRHRRGVGRHAGAARDRGGQLLDLRVPRGRALARGRRAHACERPGRALSHRRRSRDRRRGETVAVHVAPDPAEAEGVNTRVELAAAAAALRDRINVAHMLEGVTIVDPASTWIDPTVALEADSVVHPFTVLRGATTVAAGASVGPHVVALDATIGSGSLVGPFCYLRPGTVLEDSAKAGTFVELKNTVLGEGAKVPHLSYMGDADIGAGANVGAGSITANLSHHPERGKSRTKIGRDVKVAVDTMFVAPVTLGDDAWTAPGTVVTDDVPANALVGFAPRQEVKEGRGGNRDD